MKIKGQNLRLFVGNQPIAAALSCTLSVDCTTEDATTKDSTGGWNDIVVTSKTAQIQAEAVVTRVSTTPVQTRHFIEGVEEITINGSTYKADPNIIYLRPGDSLDWVVGANIGVALIDDHGTSVIVAGQTGNAPRYLADSDIRVRFAYYDHVVEPAFYDITQVPGEDALTASDIIDMISSRNVVNGSFCLSSGYQNRDEVQTLVSCDNMIASQVTVTAQNRTRATLSLTLHCLGELTFSTPGAPTVMALFDDDDSQLEGQSEPEPEPEPEPEEN